MALPVYLDCAATTPVDPRVIEAMSPFLTNEWGNAGSRTHEYGVRAKRASEVAREQLAAVVSCNAEEVIFTSGATESDNLAILGLADHGIATERKHIVTTALEHNAVLGPVALLETRGFEVSRVAPDRSGVVSVDAICAELRSDTLLVSMMHVNNETGAIQPVGACCEALSDHPAYFHVDAAQGFGKDLRPLCERRIDMCSVSGHKLFAPKGVGALIVRRRGRDRVPLTPVMVGGGQERGLRPGTLPVFLAVAFGLAAELAMNEASDRWRATERLRDELLAGLAPLEPVINSGDPCIPGIVNLSFPGVDSEAAMVALKDVIAISNGSACTSQKYEPSHVLNAMGLPEGQKRGALRWSWSHNTVFPSWPEVVSRLSRLQ